LGVAVVGMAGTVLAALIGPWAIRLVFGPSFDLRGGDLGALAAGSGCYMAALALVQALIATSSYKRIAVGWAIGTVVFVAVTAGVPGLFPRVELGFLAGSGASAVVLFFIVRGMLRH